MGSIHTQILPKALAAGLRPRSTNSLRRLQVWHAELEMMLTLYSIKTGFHSRQMLPKALAAGAPPGCLPVLPVWHAELK